MGIIAGVGSPQAQSIASGGKVYAYNAILSASNTTVAPANPNRTKIKFHNPGVVDILISPALAFTAATGVTPAALTPTTVNTGGCFLVFANGGTLDISGECQGAFQALAVSGSTGKLTVMDSNIG